MKGVYQHCSSQHLKRYLAEFDFRYKRAGWVNEDKLLRVFAHLSNASLVTKKKRIKKDDKEQSQRFVETAKKLGADESGRSFARAFKKLFSSKL